MYIGTFNTAIHVLYYKAATSRKKNKNKKNKKIKHFMYILKRLLQYRIDCFLFG